MVDCPAPVAQAGQVLIANASSLISAGTEKMVMDLASKSLLGKARERPDHVRRVLEKVRNEGLFNTVRAVREKLDEPMTMGYSSAGVVVACGHGVECYKPGDRVASNGNHAELVAVPVNLTARIPDNVCFDHAAFGVLGSISLHGVRLSKTTLGETVFVIGLGLVGQLAVGLLSAAGCRVIGTDLDAGKCELALKMGADIARPGLNGSNIEELTAGAGADAVLITASTKSNGPIELAAAAVRKRGRVVLVGVVGLELDRRPFYFKEAEFVVSCSYGPGRYDPAYEDRGHDYPLPYVRWTEQRNISAVLQAIGSGRLNIEPLISHRFGIAQAHEAYSMIKERTEPFLGVLLQYKNASPPGNSPHVLQLNPQLDRTDSSGVGVLGAGNFARMVLIPKIVEQGLFQPISICSARGVNAKQTGEKYGFETATSDENEIFADDRVQTVFSITQHNLHAAHVLRAIKAKKHVFVEKPLCLSVEELTEIETALQQAGENAPLVMVGFNRRFAPLAISMKQSFADLKAPLTVSFRFNAGANPFGHWTQDPEIGGGRILGEACHAIDFVTWLTGSLPVKVFAESIGGKHAPEISDDQAFITLRHANGSVSSIAYLAGGDKACPKERVEVFGGGRTAILEDFRQLTTFKSGKRSETKTRQDKGHAAEVKAFADAVTGNGELPISWAEIRSTTLASILAVQSMREGVPFEL